MKKIICTLFIGSLLLISCKSNNNISANYNHEIECMGVEFDGTVTLKSWGKGKNRADALEQANKEAVYAVLFSEIRNGKQECNGAPILNTPNIRNTKSDYFDAFFKDKGYYQKFVSNEDESFGKKEKEKGRDGDVMYGYIVRVKKNDLKKQMLKDGILNK